MKIKLNKSTISTILWLLGEIITLFRQIHKDNKENELGEAFGSFADKMALVKSSIRYIEFQQNLDKEYERLSKKG